MERISKMKRFIVITWSLNTPVPTGFDYVRDADKEVKFYPRRKEARHDVANIETDTGFNYKVIRINV